MRVAVREGGVASSCGPWRWRGCCPLAKLSPSRRSVTVASPDELVPRRPQRALDAISGALRPPARRPVSRPRRSNTVAEPSTAESMTCALERAETAAVESATPAVAS